LAPYDNLLKPAYWAKVYQQMQKEKYGDEADTKVYSRGDYLQAALCNMDLGHFVSNLILQANDNEAPSVEPEGVSAMDLMQALRVRKMIGEGHQ
jgi:hypothetical protein